MNYETQCTVCVAIELKHIFLLHLEAYTEVLFITLLSLMSLELF